MKAINQDYRLCAERIKRIEERLALDDTFPQINDEPYVTDIMKSKPQPGKLKNKLLSYKSPKPLAKAKPTHVQESEQDPYQIVQEFESVLG